MPDDFDSASGSRALAVLVLRARRQGRRTSEAECVHWQQKGYQDVYPIPRSLRDVRYKGQPQRKS